VTVELYRASLDLERDREDAFAAALSDEELARSDALQDPQARRRWIADHGWRRRLLAERLPAGLANRLPSQLAFEDNGHGKPRLAGPGPHFSASRSGDVAWYALCEQAEVGVDVERIDRGRSLERLAQRLMSARERTIYDAVPDPARAEAVYACWTCKEAAVKALGSGLAFPLTAIEAWTGDGAPMRAGGLEVRGLGSDEGRTAAVAVRVQTGDTVAIGAVVGLMLP
jgi:4'-phosphopantetheinyl transferase